MSTLKWYSVSVTVPHEVVEAIEFALNSLDALGTEIGDMPADRGLTVRVVGYFNEPPEEPSLTEEIAHAFVVHDLPGDTPYEVSLGEVEDRDWLAEWKKYWKPQTVGRFVIAPPWAEVDEPGKIVIRIEPNMAFGTGTHETTQLCLSAVERVVEPGMSFLDVGTGTGILAIGAAKISTAEGTESPEKSIGGADGVNSSSKQNGENSLSLSSGPSVVKKILACDTDLDAMKIARENAAANGVADLIEFIDGPLPADSPTFDVVCANLTLGDILPILKRLLSRTQRTLILSGILAEQEEAIVSALQENSINGPKIERAGEWISVVCFIP
jgi:ribosomal protein L11 methyltransferase